MEERVQPWEQPWLLPYINPWPERFGKDFFKSLPKTPGIYRFIGLGGGVLYVGKAKNLKHRLNSYKLAKPGRVSRKVIRLIHVVEKIEWEECGSEALALLRENALLRELDPPFNVVNTQPDSYYFIATRLVGKEMRFRLTTNPKRQGDLMHGAYKGRRIVRDGYGALLRLIWAIQSSEARWEFPSRLTRRVPPYIQSLPFPEDWVGALKKFLNGTDDRLLTLITEKMLENESIPRFAYHVIQQDLETLAEFYERCPRRNCGLRRAHHHKSRVIAQDMIDDLLVFELVRQGKVSQ